MSDTSRALQTIAIARPTDGHHRAIHDILIAHVAPLQRQIRPHVIATLVDRVVAMEPDSGSFLALEENDQLWTLVVHVIQACRAIAREERADHDRFERFSRVYHGAGDPASRERAIREYIDEAVLDPRRRKGDLQAVQRHLDLDVLNERRMRSAEKRGGEVEIALTFVAGALAVLVAGPTGGIMVHRVLGHGDVEPTLAEHLEPARRWQTRLAALRGLIVLYTALDEHELLKVADAGILRQAIDLLHDIHESPWLQIAALDLLVVLSPHERRAVIYQRLLGDRDPRAPDSDFLVRRKFVEFCEKVLSRSEALVILDQLIAARDPSEHVRMGVADTLGTMGTVDAIELLHALVDGDAQASGGSARVRASAAIAARRGGAEGDDLEAAFASLTVLERLLRGDQDPLVLEVTGEECVALCQAVTFVPIEMLQAALLARRADPTLPPAVHEALSAAAERIERHHDPTREAWIAYLAGKVARMAPGSSQSIAVELDDPSLPDHSHGPEWIGRLLSELSRCDWGVSAEVRGSRLTLWRGDHTRRRLWRLWHELIHPAPNKRQAHSHTTGRVHKGSLRAPSGVLDEVTATTVPGERVMVDREGSWGRHLPAVDDLIDLPVLRSAPTTVFSSHGALTLTPPRRLWSRLRNRIALIFRYRRLAQLRLASLQSDEPAMRRRYLDAVSDRMGIRCDYTPYDYLHVTQDDARPAPSMTSLLPRSTASLAALPTIGDLTAWVDDKMPYLLDHTANSQTALALFAGGLAGWILGESYYKRSRIRRARERIPLCIGGWGTRGKSGTERIKAGLFHGLGYQVFTKTTGCEAMFIHALPGQTAHEIFIYRPYDKATIWEQRMTVELAAAVGAEVYLWECMALNPTYVRLLQHDWMHDDLVTLTNAFPDHEDIQGPTGRDVAEVISSFIPRRSTLITTEINFLPLFRDRCDELDTELLAVPARDADLIPEDILRLFPYQEHPRNIALVARMAELLGVERWQAMALMAENVVPDLGVLKTYPAIRLRGRTLSFTNGMSANERAGCMGNWRRCGFDRIDLEREPERCVVTVINNRDDRISRSEVFARIVVEDLVADRHVLIGTNQRGFLGYVDDALKRYTRSLTVLEPGDNASAGDDDSASRSPCDRLAGYMARLRIPRPRVAAMLDRLRIIAAGGERVVAPHSLLQLEKRLTVLLEPSSEPSSEPSPDPSVLVGEVRQELAGDSASRQLIELALVPVEPGATMEAGDGSPTVAGDGPPELLAPASVDEIIEHFYFSLARVVVHARLAARVRRAEAHRAEIAACREAVRQAYTALFRELIVVVPDAAATGDQVVAQCLRAIAPGARAEVMGIQNIKGTGLDFVYRWVAVDRVTGQLDALSSHDRHRRRSALRELESIGDHGLMDSALIRVVVGRHLDDEQATLDERSRMERLCRRMDGIVAERQARLMATGRRTVVERVLGWLEGGIDNLDSIRRTRQARRIGRDLAAERISLGRAAVEMRAITGRQKGGWLARSFKRALQRARGRGE